MLVWSVITYMTMVTGLKKRNEVLDIFQGILYDTVKLEILFVQIPCCAMPKPSVKKAHFLCRFILKFLVLHGRCCKLFKLHNLHMLSLNKSSHCFNQTRNCCQAPCYRVPTSYSALIVATKHMHSFCFFMFMYKSYFKSIVYIARHHMHNSTYSTNTCLAMISIELWRFKI